jgi:hypothetical protein
MIRLDELRPVPPQLRHPFIYFIFVFVFDLYKVSNVYGKGVHVTY